LESPLSPTPPEQELHEGADAPDMKHRPEVLVVAAANTPVVAVAYKALLLPVKSVNIIWSTALMVMSDPAPVVCKTKEEPSMVIASPPSPRVTTPLASKVPLAVRVPVTVKALLTVVVPVDAPTERVVAAPAKLTVVAVVLIRLNVVEPVVREVVISGDVPKTATPVPVSSVRVLRSADERPE